MYDPFLLFITFGVLKKAKNVVVVGCRARGLRIARHFEGFSTVSPVLYCIVYHNKK